MLTVNLGDQLYLTLRMLILVNFLTCAQPLSNQVIKRPIQNSIASAFRPSNLL